MNVRAGGVRKTDDVQPISRRLFLAGSASIVVTACSGGGDGTAPTTAAPSPDPTTDSAAESSSGTTEATPDSTTSAPSTAPTTVPATTTTALPPVALSSDPFTLGVASGDPGEGSVVLWTRLAPTPIGDDAPADEAYTGDIGVHWIIAADADFTDVRAEGVATAQARYAHSLHVPATLDAGDWYYRFEVGGYTSPVGLTRPAPAATADPASLRFASASCQHYETGYYTAHADIAAQDLDFVVFLGDYIYEGGRGVVGEGEEPNVRSHDSGECRTLDDYRNRYALYKRDPHLQAAHASCPWYVTWDDHEVENNYAGTTPQDPVDAAAFVQRRHDAYQAWWEHQPVALPPPPDNGDYPIYRAAQWGSLLDLVLLDGRQYRSDQACTGGTLNFDPACPETFDPNRSMLGDNQEQWLTDRLAEASTVWNVIGQQTVFGDATIGEAVLNYDQWDGYPAQRNRLVDSLAALPAPNNNVVLTGDIHFAGTGIIRSGGRGTGTPVAVEFVATSISSGGRINPSVTDVVRAIPDIIDVELEHRGYILHTVTADAWNAEYRMVETVKELDAPVYAHRTYLIDAGTNTVRPADA